MRDTRRRLYEQRPFWGFFNRLLGLFRSTQPERDEEMALSVYCIAKRDAQAVGLANRLRQTGFSASDISVLAPDRSGMRDFGHQITTKAPEGATAGAGTGALLGGALGWLAGIGALAIPGLGPFIAAGPIMAALAGAGVGGTVGGLVGALVGMGIPEYEAKRYEGRIKSGGILLSVHCDDSEWTKKAKQILEETGAEDVSSTGESSADFSKSDRPMPGAGDPASERTVVVADESLPPRDRKIS